VVSASGTQSGRPEGLIGYPPRGAGSEHRLGRHETGSVVSASGIQSGRPEGLNSAILSEERQAEGKLRRRHRKL
jgi:hypothetical protein